MSKRRRSSVAFRSKVALDALREDAPLSVIAARHQIHARRVGNGKLKRIGRPRR